MDKDFPRWYGKTREEYRKYIEALENLGETVRKQGPLDEKTSQLIQLAAAAAIRSEGLGPQPCQEGNEGRSNARRDLPHDNAAYQHDRVSNHLRSFELGL